MHLRQLEHRLAIVAETLREVFPQDFHKRCTYASFGILALLRDAGEEASVVGGDLLAFILPRDGKNPSMKGFGNVEGECSHFWVQTPERLIDLGTHFLPEDANVPVAKMPAVAWEISAGFPNYLRYRERGRFAQHTEMDGDHMVAEKGKAFVERCHTRLANQTAQLKFPTWVVTGRPSVAIAAKRGDRWAIGAEKFDGWVDPRSIPF